MKSVDVSLDVRFIRLLSKSLSRQ